MNAAIFRTPADTQVELVRSFDANVELVWKVFSEPEFISQWMQGPPGWSMPVCETDFRVGGKYENRFRNDEDGTEFGLAGEYREIEPHSRIVHDESYGLVSDGDNYHHTAIVTMTFQASKGTTTVSTLIEYASQEARDAALATGMVDAMEMGYRCMDALLAGNLNDVVGDGG